MKYDELMDKIEVTDAMRARILRNVSAAAPKKTPVRRYTLLAACLAVVLLGAVCVPKLMDPAPQGEQVAIDLENDVQYVSMCPQCYFKAKRAFYAEKAASQAD